MLWLSATPRAVLQRVLKTLWHSPSHDCRIIEGRINITVRGFAFVGPTTMFAFMESIGLVDTDLLDSHRRGCSKYGTPTGDRPVRPI
jgi:hypothetical protein